MAYNKEAEQRREELSFWMKQEFVVASITTLIFLFIIYPIYDNISLSQCLDFLFNFLVLLTPIGITFFIGIIFALFQMLKAISKKNNNSIRENFGKSVTLISLIIIGATCINYTTTSSPGNWPSREGDFFTLMFIVSCVYLIVTFFNLKRIEKKRKSQIKTGY